MPPEIKTGPKRIAVAERVASGRMPTLAHRVPDRSFATSNKRRKTYTDKQKIQILHLKRTAWVPDPENDEKARRTPSWEEIEQWTGIPGDTAMKWPAQEAIILEGREMGRQKIVVGDRHQPGPQAEQDDEEIDAVDDHHPDLEYVGPDEIPQQQPRPQPAAGPLRRNRRENPLWDVPARAHVYGQLVVSPTGRRAAGKTNYRTQSYLPPDDPLWDIPATQHTTGQRGTPHGSAAFWWSKKAWE
ncbi:hypothetical protein FN846DRAFT_889958 [Sphaerosporella brunnea]|uniref:Uncharacterized protein n=1 Tax=Sphaerosporella brunnea TaxID=1250544 RepID=A0A5J5EY30_9PEZI|nr:hypothetical protein FN846DRAFT_906719 [Sphaerosporella brunnea]KAA8906937.1 hypothetical protein FN846DRAFT_889958 [Sphaerosporella brunnea]